MALRILGGIYVEFGELAEKLSACRTQSKEAIKFHQFDVFRVYGVACLERKNGFSDFGFAAFTNPLRVENNEGARVHGLGELRLNGFDTVEERRVAGSGLNGYLDGHRSPLANVRFRAVLNTAHAGTQLYQVPIRPLQLYALEGIVSSVPAVALSSKHHPSQANYVKNHKQKSSHIVEHLVDIPIGNKRNLPVMRAIGTNNVNHKSCTRGEPSVLNHQRRRLCCLNAGSRAVDDAGYWEILQEVGSFRDAMITRMKKEKLRDRCDERCWKRRHPEKIYSEPDGKIFKRAGHALMEFFSQHFQKCNPLSPSPQFPTQFHVTTISNPKRTRTTKATNRTRICVGIRARQRSTISTTKRNGKALSERWTSDQEIKLAMACCGILEHQITGNEEQHIQFWKRVTKRYNDKMVKKCGNKRPDGTVHQKPAACQMAEFTAGVGGRMEEPSGKLHRQSDTAGLIDFCSAFFLVFIRTSRV
ncbi:hypothetical protein LXL04_002286 [Taraxacum kok-saghyz]